LLQTQKIFNGIGSISQRKNKDAILYSVYHIKDLTNIIISNFENLPLLSQKAADLLLFKKIINIKSSMNLGLSDLQKSEFPNYQSVERKLIQNTNFSDSQWVAGFISGEGCFEVNTFKLNTHKIGSQVRLRFTVVQHERDKNLMELLFKYLGCGKVYKKSNLSVVELRIVKLDDVKKIVIPLFEKSSIQSVKQLDF
jgi:hypothetical protein